MSAGRGSVLHPVAAHRLGAVIRLWRNRVAQQPQQGFAVAFDLGLTDAGNVEQIGRAGRAPYREFAQGLVMQDDIGRHTLFPGQIGTPGAQGLEQRRISRGQFGRVRLPCPVFYLS